MAGSEDRRDKDDRVQRLDSIPRTASVAWTLSPRRPVLLVLVLVPCKVPILNGLQKTSQKVFLVSRSHFHPSHRSPIVYQSIPTMS